MTTTAQDFRNAVDKVCTDFNWATQVFTQDDEFAVLTELAGDEHFDQVLWVLDTSRNTLRCLVTTNMQVPDAQATSVLELCARINDGLTFGCAEYSFADQLVVFRDGAELEGQDLDAVVSDTSARLFSMAMRYGPAVKAVLSGESPANAITQVENSNVS